MKLARTLGILLCVIGLIAPAGAVAQSLRNKKSKEDAVGPADYTSKNFLMHTDMPAEEATALLKRMETMLALISKYWGRPPSGTIECYVIRNVKSWPAGKLDPTGVAMVEAGGGVTLGRVLTDGVQFLAKSPLYAAADGHTPLHESVHAYCIQAFGRTGPVWYAEGMAEMGQYWVEGDSKVNCDPLVVDYIKGAEAKELLAIVDPRERTGDSGENYAWRWALCHLLANNPNYAPRFRPLGMGLLTGQDVSFESVYGSMAKEIQFEYTFFLKHFDRGYRVDLCAWDWKAKVKPLSGATSLSPKIDAAHGWQATRIRVDTDQEYEYSVTGKWKTAKDGEAVNADGGEEGQGKLVGIIFDDYTLSEPFELGTYGTFTPPTQGHLLLRCQDTWHEIADNSGKVTVRIKTKGKGNPLPKPKE